MSPALASVNVDVVGALLLSSQRPIKERFRALFTLKAVRSEAAISWMAKAFSDPSALLKHEVAYCLGQTQLSLAIPILAGVLSDRQGQEPIVRHEAAEALAAIGGNDALQLVKDFSNDPVQEVRETCQLALAKLEFQQKCLDGLEKAEVVGDEGGNTWGSVDPAPPLLEVDPIVLKTVLLNPEEELFIRYRAMFSLRNRRDEESILVLAEALSCPSSALFRHEVAFVLGQVASPLALPQLLARLRDEQENPMVRHEAAEALGDIPGVKLEEVMSKYLHPEVDPILRESCEIALDMADYNNSKEFQHLTLSA